jgi:hypothetical protein
MSDILIIILLYILYLITVFYIYFYYIIYYKTGVREKNQTNILYIHNKQMLLFTNLSNPRSAKLTLHFSVKVDAAKHLCDRPVPLTITYANLALLSVSDLKGCRDISVRREYNVLTAILAMREFTDTTCGGTNPEHRPWKYDCMSSCI